MEAGTWVIQGRVIRSISDYILGIYQRRLEMVGIRVVRNYPSYHLILIARLLIYITKAGHQCDTGGIPKKMVTMHGGIEDAKS